MIVVTLSDRIKRKLLIIATLTIAFVLGGWALTSVEDYTALISGGLKPIQSVQTLDDKLALTFDISWGETIPTLVLDILKEQGVEATFFVSGPWVGNHPELAKRIVEDGHQLESLGYQHLNLSQYEKEAVQECITKAHDIIKEVTGIECKFFRPPFGDYDDLVIETAMELGYTVVTWDTDSRDWLKPGVDQITRRVLAKAHPGDIILMHASDGATQTHSALPTIVSNLRERGFELLTLDDLLDQEGQ